MNKPYWQTKHDWWVEDFQFLKDMKDDFIKMVRKHPDFDDEIGNSLRACSKELDVAIARKKREYKKIYGTNFNMKRLEE